MTKPECPMRGSGLLRHSSFGFHWSFWFGHWSFPSPPIPLLAPRIPVHVVAVLFPEPGRVGGAEFDPADPLGALPQVQPRHQAAQRPAVVGGEVLAFPLVRE